jgi:hypothetical protein
MAPKYRPILFSLPMVQAILEGKKTQTRRTQGLELLNSSPYQFRYGGFNPEDQFHYMQLLDENGNTTEKYKEIDCPYNIGDVLWVRETFYKCTSELMNNKYYYKATTVPDCTFKWIPSIHMKREAARIFLKIKSIRIEKLQDISEADAIQEGVKDSLSYSDLKILEGLGGLGIPRPFRNHQFGFLSIWCSIYKCENWLNNPFVWVYEFEPIERPSNFLL